MKYYGAGNCPFIFNGDKMNEELIEYRIKKLEENEEEDMTIYDWQVLVLGFVVGALVMCLIWIVLINTP